MRTGADRTLELLDGAGGAPGERGRDARRDGRPRPARGQPAGPAVVLRQHGIALWPHTKTHKSPEIGLRQLALGAGGLTVAKTGEAAGLPGGRRAAHPRALPALRHRQVGAPRAHRGRGRRADGRGRRPAAGRGARGGARAPRRTRDAARRDGRRPAPHRPDDGRRRARARAGALAPPAPSRWPASAATPGTAGAMPRPCARASRPSTSCCARRATPSSPRACAAIASRAARRPRAT